MSIFDNLNIKVKEILESEGAKLIRTAANLKEENSRLREALDFADGFSTTRRFNTSYRGPVAISFKVTPTGDGWTVSSYSLGGELSETLPDRDAALGVLTEALRDASHRLVKEHLS